MMNPGTSRLFRLIWILSVGIVLLGLAGLSARRHTPLKGQTADAESDSGLGDGWRRSTAAEQIAAVRIVVRQIDAFKKCNYQEAWGLESDRAKKHFPSLSPFKAAIRSQYPQFLSFVSVTCGSAAVGPSGRRFVLPVTVAKSDGRALELLYVLAPGKQGLRVEELHRRFRAAPAFLVSE